MSKPRIYGMKSGYIPNDKADMRSKPHIYQRGREIAERDTIEFNMRREMKRLEREKKRGGVGRDCH